MQSVSSRIWTRIAVFISYGDNNYTRISLEVMDSQAIDITFQSLLFGENCLSTA